MRCKNCFSPLPSGLTCKVCQRAGNVQRSQAALLEGAVLTNQFLLGCVLGAGGFGITYLAWDMRLEIRVAIKEYFSSQLAIRRPDGRAIVASAPEHNEQLQYGLRSFLQEARTLAGFDHPHIVRVRTYFEENSTGYLVMSYYDGLSLQAYMDRHAGPFPEKDALRIILPVLDGLEVVHAHGLLHRDIKPSNIYLANGWHPVLLDFGSARLALTMRNRTLTVIVTPGFAPPEQYASRGRQGAWTDVYACAATLYYLVTGVAPPPALDRAQGARLTPLESLNQQLSPAFRATVERGLALHPEHRPQSVNEFRSQLTMRGPVPVPEVTPGAKTVGCPRCGARNKVLANQPWGTAFCGRCGQGLRDQMRPGVETLVVCRHCGARNNLRQRHEGTPNGRARRPLCGKCGELLQPVPPNQAHS